MALVLMGLSIVVFLFAGRMRRAGEAGRSRALLVLTVVLAVLAVLAAVNEKVREGALVTPPAPTSP